MKKLLSKLRKNYFDDIASIVQPVDIQFVILTHLLEDRPELVDAIRNIGTVSLIISIPYSHHKKSFEILKENYYVATPTLEQLYDSDYLTSLIISHTKPKVPLVIIEIGGYCAPILNKLQEKLHGSLLGVIEDTEAGHRKYQKISNSLPCPVISVARSSLKETEDFLVGTSCLYSTERLLRDNGFLIDGKSSLVLGFGKIGRGLSHALSRRYCPVAIYDVDPIRRINALSEGFQVPSKKSAFNKAEIIYGAAGRCSITNSDLKLIKNGALLVSCSSKNLEFDLASLNKHYSKTFVSNGIDCYSKKDQFLYLANDGTPINFRDGAVIGPILALVQAELLLAIKQLIQTKEKKGLFETELVAKKFLAEKWLQYFCDEVSGRYLLEGSSQSSLFEKFMEDMEIVSN